MVTLGGGLEPNLYKTVQPPGDTVHDVALNVPPPLSVKDSVPVGVVGELDVSLTVAKNFTDPAGLTVV
jgi:hypothetical protein